MLIICKRLACNEVQISAAFLSCDHSMYSWKVTVPPVLIGCARPIYAVFGR